MASHVNTMRDMQPRPPRAPLHLHTPTPFDCAKDLGDWQQQDASLFFREGQPCLAKRPAGVGHSATLASDDVWCHAHVLHCDADSSTCVVQWGHHRPPYHRLAYNRLEETVSSLPVVCVHLLPAESLSDSSDADDDDQLSDADDDNCNGNSLDDDSDSDDDVASGNGNSIDQPSAEAAPPGRGCRIPGRRRVAFVSGGLLLPDCAPPTADGDTSSPTRLNQITSYQLGFWESHTRGIGSRLLTGMGYSGYGGLGRYGQGREAPVAVCLAGKQILPRAWNKRPSLDVVCRRQESMRVKIQQATTSGAHLSSGYHHSLFDFMNKALFRPPTTKESHIPSSKSAPSIFKMAAETASGTHGNSLRRELLSSQEAISQVKSKIRAAKLSLARNQGRDQVISRQVENRLAGLQTELVRLQTQERVLQSSQKKADNLKKLSVF